MEECTNSRNNKRNHGDDCNKCNHSDCCDCCDCSCCEGPVGPRGRTGPAGDKGDTGDKGDKGDTGAPGDCCCKDAVKYALGKIGDKEVSLISFNTTKTGKIVADQTNPDVVHLQETTGQGTPGEKKYNYYVSLCNVILITFPSAPSVDQCSTPKCCCNQDVSSALATLIGAYEQGEPPKSVGISIDIIDNTNKSLDIVKVYGICNGILWAEFENAIASDKYGAIPLCSIFSAEQTSTKLSLPTMEKRVTNLEDTVDELDQRVIKLEKK